MITKLAAHIIGIKNRNKIEIKKRKGKKIVFSGGNKTESN